MPDGLETLLSFNLGLRAGENLVFVYDESFESLVDRIRSHSVQHGIALRILPITYDGIQPLPAELQQILLGDEHRVVLFAVVHNIWHTPERKKAKYGLGKRLATIVCAPDRLDQSTPAQVIPRIAAATRALFNVFRPGSLVHITSAAGTDFTARVNQPFREDGEYSEPGTGGDFPAGEVGFGPQQGSVDGRIVYDVKVQHLGLLDSPLVLSVEHDRVVEVAGVRRGDFDGLCGLRGEMLRFISEISLGLNPFVGVTPEPQFIPEEKTYGTAHCGHGGNSSYGDRTGPHIDGVIAEPTVEIDGVRVMENGKLLSGTIPGIDLEWLRATNVDR